MEKRNRIVQTILRKRLITPKDFDTEEAYLTYVLQLQELVGNVLQYPVDVVWIKANQRGWGRKDFIEFIVSVVLEDE